MIRLFALVFFVLPLTAQTWSIVVSKKCCASCNTHTRLVYLKKQRYIGLCKSNPVSLPFDTPERLAFMREVLQMDMDRWERYWSTMHFKGVDAPIVLQSPTAVAKFVQKMPGTVGYIPGDLVDGSMTVLERFQP